jgi:phosphate transport system substrate-binding protein
MICEMKMTKTFEEINPSMKTSYTIFSVLVALSLLLAGCAQSPASSSAGETSQPGQLVQINGAGATFPLPVYTEWIYAYQSVDPAVSINYQGIGSGGGKKGIIDGTIDFAGSDSVLKDEEYTAGKDLQMVPMLAGAVVPIYNLDGIESGLTLDSATLARIYLGQVMKWNDPEITAANPDLKDKLPDQTITVVHRSDGSGTTEMFTNALAAFSDEWKNSVGAGSAVEWPVDKNGNGVGGKGNQGVAAAVQNTPNSIGYVELSYALSNKIPFANLVNQAGQSVTANADSLASAMSDFSGSFTDKLTNQIVDGPGEKSWPISGYTYIILHKTNMTDCTKATKIGQFLKWSLTDPVPAQKAADLGYAVLPQDVRTKVLAELGKVMCNGTPLAPVQ